MLQIDTASKIFQFITENHGRRVLLLEGVTRSGAIGYLPIEIEICGGEVVDFVPPGKEVRLEYLQFTGLGNIQRLRPHIYYNLVSSSS